MAHPYRKYEGKTYREIGWALRYKQMPEPLVEQTLAAIREWRNQNANDKRMKAQRNKAWGEVITALQHERRIVRSMLRYKSATPTPERDALFSAYADLLTKLYEKLHKQRHLDRALPEHSHWTDFVPERVKAAFRLEEDAVPHKQKAKTKALFQRTSPITLCTLRHGRILRKARADLLAVRQVLLIKPDDEQAKRKAHALETAITRIKDMEINAHVPNHWADMVPDLLVKNQPELTGVSSSATDDGL
jgi:hypothetical protein